MIIRLIPIKETEKEKFIKDLQSAFEVSVIKEYGKQDEEAIPRKDIEDSINAKGVETFNISLNNEIVGGVAIAINEKTLHNSLELFFIKENYQSKGIGLSVWKAVEKKYPNTKVWETVTPYFEKRNIFMSIDADLKSLNFLILIIKTITLIICKKIIQLDRIIFLDLKKK